MVYGTSWGDLDHSHLGHSWVTPGVNLGEGHLLSEATIQHAWKPPAVKRRNEATTGLVMHLAEEPGGPSLQDRSGLDLI